MRRLVVLMVVGLLVGTAHPAVGLEPLTSSKPDEPTPGWSFEPVESQDLGTANHSGLCDFTLEYSEGPSLGVVDWVIVPWVSHEFFSDDIVADGVLPLDAFGGGVTDVITLPADHYYDFLWTEDGVVIDWIPLFLTNGCQVVFESPPPDYVVGDGVGVVDQSTGLWTMRLPDGSAFSFFYGNPGDVPFMGDWDCDGIASPGLYRQSDGFAYLRNSNTQGIADIRFFFGNPGDFPIAGDFDGNGCDTLSIYRSSEARWYVINELGANDGGLGAADISYLFGDVGDIPFVGDWNNDGIDTPGLRRFSNGFVYVRDSNSQGIADASWFYGDNGDHVFTGDFNGDGTDSIGLSRPSNTTIYLRNALSTGNADTQFTLGNPDSRPVAGRLD